MLNVRADVVESLIAALYLDGGLEVARKFILRYWERRAIRPDGARRDAKTELQEWAHAKFGVTPVYRVDDRSGPDHDPRFTVTVEVAGTAPETGLERPSAPPSRWLRHGFWSAKVFGRPSPLRNERCGQKRRIQ